MTTIVNRENKQIYRDGDTLVKVFDEKAYTKAQVLNENILKNLLPFKWKFIQRNALCSTKLRKKCMQKSALLLMKLL